MVEICTTLSSPESIENRLMPALNLDYRDNLERLKKLTSDSFEDGAYETDLFRPTRTESDTEPNAGLSRIGLLKRYQTDGWRFGTLEHLIRLSADAIELMHKTHGIPVVAIGSYDESLSCPVVHTYVFDAHGLLLDLESVWGFEEMPYFLRVRKI